MLNLPTGRFSAEVISGSVLVQHESTCSHYQRLPYPTIYIRADTLKAAERKASEITANVKNLTNTDMVVKVLRHLGVIVVTEKPHDSKWMESRPAKRQQFKHGTANKAARLERPRGVHAKEARTVQDVGLTETRVKYTPPKPTPAPIHGHYTAQELIDRNKPNDSTSEKAIMEAAIKKLDDEIRAEEDRLAAIAAIPIKQPRRTSRRLVGSNVDCEEALAFCLICKEEGITAACEVASPSTNHVYIVGGVRSKAAKELAGWFTETLVD